MTVFEHAASIYCVCQNKVLLIWHENLGNWFPPGGHIETGELPSAAALREFSEETGIVADMFPSSKPQTSISDVESSIAPIHQQMEFIAENHHHIDHIYVASPAKLDFEPFKLREPSPKWFSRDDLLTKDIPPSVRDMGAYVLSRFDFSPVQFMHQVVQFEDLELPHVSVVIGPPGSGKSATVGNLVSQAINDGAAIGVINCDIGRPSFGPPSCVCCGVATPVGVQILGATFVGGLTACGFTSRIVSIAAFYRRLLTSIGVDHIIVDTPGYVFGSEANWFMDHLISETRPDLVISQCDPFEREDYRASLQALSLCPQYTVTPTMALPLPNLTERRKWHQRLISDHFGCADKVRLQANNTRFWTLKGEVGIDTVASDYIGYFAAFDEFPIPIICQIIDVVPGERAVILRIPEGTGSIFGNLTLGEFFTDTSGILSHRPGLIDDRIVAQHFPGESEV